MPASDRLVTRPLEQSMAAQEDQWRELAGRHHLSEPHLDRS
ncbi:hypothetical protein ACRB8A_16725 [Arthrobacter sp. G.S.26]